MWLIGLIMPPISIVQMGFIASELKVEIVLMVS